ncbi:zf-HC2 domain-containing protein [Clostridium nigeriense]|uniref:zf-HC2 domain-containing protein n=1 Tax=Clostridium nigeriense TaxID=1805470 RepID=UPI003D34CCAD
MNYISCRIIEDLLPLYVDGVCSEESKKYIESHISTCEECHKKLEEMKYSIPKSEIQNNIDDGAMLKKLSDTWKAKTKLNIKSSIFCIIIYVLTIGTLFISQIGEQGYYRFEIKYMLASNIANFIFYMVFGAFITYLACRQKGSSKTNILELIIIGIPSILMALNVFYWFLLPLRLPSFIVNNSPTISKIGCILLGCEIARVIKNSKIK